MNKRKQGNWMSAVLVDMRGNSFTLGDAVAKACTSGRAVNLEIAVVTRIEEGRLYLSNSKVPINFPGRLLILPRDYA